MNGSELEMLLTNVWRFDSYYSLFMGHQLHMLRIYNNKKALFVKNLRDERLFLGILRKNTNNSLY